MLHAEGRHVEARNRRNFTSSHSPSGSTGFIRRGGKIVRVTQEMSRNSGGLSGGRKVREPKRGGFDLAALELEVRALAAWCSGEGPMPKYQIARGDNPNRAPERKDKQNLRNLRSKLRKQDWAHQTGSDLTERLDSFASAHGRERSSRGKAQAEKIKSERITYK